jgi:phenylpropionate dioxygenase-like ring-hydroxylating dioxygenase large terminal subunit
LVDIAELDLFVGLSDADDVELCQESTNTIIKGNWKLAAENSMDGYHAPIVHASFGQALMDKIKNNPSRNSARRRPLRHRWGDEDLGNGHMMLDYKMRITTR